MNNAYCFNKSKKILGGITVNKSIDASFMNSMDLHYMQGYEQGMADERKEIVETLARLVTCEVITIEQYELIRMQIGEVEE